DDHATALPLMSVIVTTVLLNVDWMWAIPAEMFLRTFFFCLTLLAVFGAAIVRTSCTSQGPVRGLGFGAACGPIVITPSEPPRPGAAAACPCAGPCGCARWCASSAR